MKKEIEKITPDEYTKCELCGKVGKISFHRGRNEQKDYYFCGYCEDAF